jgi:hypothetical protein
MKVLIESLTVCQREREVIIYSWCGSFGGIFVRDIFDMFRIRGRGIYREWMGLCTSPEVIDVVTVIAFSTWVF